MAELPGCDDRRAEVVAACAMTANDEDAITRLTTVLEVDPAVASAVANMQMRHLTIGHVERLDAEIAELQAFSRARG